MATASGGVGRPGLPYLPGQGASDVPLGIRALLGTVMKMTALRPQILAAIVAATIFCTFTAWIGWKLQAVEVITGLTGAFIGFLGGISLRIIDSGTDEDKE